MTDEELLALQNEILERERVLLERSNELEGVKRAMEKELEAEWEKIRQTQKTQQTFPDPNVTSLLQNMQEQISKLTILCKQKTEPHCSQVESKNINFNNSNLIELDNGSRDNAIGSGIGLKDVLNIIPYFNGYDSSVFHFSRACKRARDMLALNKEYSLVQLIINKLKGHAFQIIQDLDISTVNDLTRQLKNIFAPPKTINQHRSELGNIYQYNGESVLDYIGRVKDLKTALLDCEKQTRANISQETLLDTKRDVTDSFVNGLRPSIRTNLKIETYSDLSDAIFKAIKISKTLEIDRKRYGNRLDNTRNTNDRNEQTTRNQNQPPQDKPNQNRDQTLNPHATSYVPKNTNQNSLPTNQQTCRYCKRTGHTIE